MRPLLLGLWLLACAEALPPPVVDPSELEAASRNEPEPPPPGVLWRDEVDAVLDAGLGRFLAFVRVEPRFDGEKFVGWELVELLPPDSWKQVDLKPGDVVTRVNGRPIERESEAYQAFISLRESDRLVVSYLRGDLERELIFRILERPGRATAKMSRQRGQAATGSRAGSSRATDRAPASASSGEARPPSSQSLPAPATGSSVPAAQTARPGAGPASVPASSSTAGAPARN